MAFTSTLWPLSAKLDVEKKMVFIDNLVSDFAFLEGKLQKFLTSNFKHVRTKNIV
jgi:hypothetical protein